MKNRKREICEKCGKERPIDPIKHLCHECWQAEKDAEQDQESWVMPPTPTKKTKGWWPNQLGDASLKK